MSKIDDLLLTQFDVPVSAYFSLTEKQKEEITRIIITQYLKTLSKEPELAPHYTYHLDYQLSYAIKREDFEKADMIKRVIEKIEDLFGKFE